MVEILICKDRFNDEGRVYLEKWPGLPDSRFTATIHCEITCTGDTPAIWLQPETQEPNDTPFSGESPPNSNSILSPNIFFFIFYLPIYKLFSFNFFDFFIQLRNLKQQFF